MACRLRTRLAMDRALLNSVSAQASRLPRPASRAASRADDHRARFELPREQRRQDIATRSERDPSGRVEDADAPDRDQTQAARTGQADPAAAPKDAPARTARQARTAGGAEGREAADAEADAAGLEATADEASTSFAETGDADAAAAAPSGGEAQAPVEAAVPEQSTMLHGAVLAGIGKPPESRTPAQPRLRAQPAGPAPLLATNGQADDVVGIGAAAGVDPAAAAAASTEVGTKAVAAKDEDGTAAESAEAATGTEADATSDTVDPALLLATPLPAVVAGPAGSDPARPAVEAARGPISVSRPAPPAPAGTDQAASALPAAPPPSAAPDSATGAAATHPLAPGIGSAFAGHLKAAEAADRNADAAATPTVTTPDSAAASVSSFAPAGPAHAAAASATHGSGASYPVVSGVPVAAVPVEIGLKSLAGVNRFDIRLAPEDLGEIEVRLDISGEGRVRAHIVVERPDALMSLQRESGQLERAFEQAGLSTGGDGISLSLRQQAQGDTGSGGGGSSDGRPQPASPLPEEAAAGAASSQTAVRRYTWSRASGVDRHI